MLAARKLTQILVATLLAVLLVGGAAPPAFAQDDSAVAINEEDGTSIFKLAFHIRRITDEVVDPTNLALAYSSCENCRTVAISIQVVLVASDPRIVAPENLALAVNFECTMCETFASAYQFVLGTGDDFHFSKEGRRAIRDIHIQSYPSRNSTPRSTASPTNSLPSSKRRSLPKRMTRMTMTTILTTTPMTRGMMTRSTRMNPLHPTRRARLHQINRPTHPLQHHLPRPLPLRHLDATTASISRGALFGGMQFGRRKCSQRDSRIP
jgi:hypothetical protein